VKCCSFVGNLYLSYSSYKTALGLVVVNANVQKAQWT